MGALKALLFGQAVCLPDGTIKYHLPDPTRDARHIGTMIILVLVAQRLTVAGHVQRWGQWIIKPNLSRGHPKAKANVLKRSN